MYSETGFQNTAVGGTSTPASSTSGIKISKDAVARVTSGLMNENNSLVLSHLHPAGKALNQLRMLEDAVVIYTLTRAPERRIFYIDVGNLPKNKAEQYLRDMMAKHKNICKYIHLPVQTGSTRMLERMNRQHTREEYMELVDNIRRIIPDCAISQDMIAGFCGETEEDHQDTLSLMEYVKYDFGFMFAYSERPGTPAAKRMEDDVPLEVKKRRLTEIIQLQQKHGMYRMKQFVGKTVEILIEGNSKKSDQHWMGRNTQNAVAVFPKGDEKVGDLVQVKIEDCTSATLIGTRIR